MGSVGNEVALWASLVAQMVKHLLAVQETWVQSLGREDRLEKEMATHSSTLAWRIPWMEEPRRLHTVHGVTNSQTQLSNFTFFLSLPMLVSSTEFTKKKTEKKNIKHEGVGARSGNQECPCTPLPRAGDLSVSKAGFTDSEFGQEQGPHTCP